MPIKLTIPLLTKIILWIVFWTLLVMLSAPLMAETSETRSSKSISFSNSTAIDEPSKDELLKQADVDIMTALVKQGYRTESLVTAVSIENFISSHIDEIIIYDAATELISDFNYDGFYHRFSVAIDADTIHDVSYVYARLYLSYEGGPWNHYASSDAYHIYADSERDIFTIETELADGFVPGYYDVRIELYDADSDEWLLSYGPYNDASLRALPLEDAYYDDISQALIYPVENDIVVAGHGHGSMSWWLILVPVLLVFARQSALRAGRK